MPVHFRMKAITSPKPLNFLIINQIIFTNIRFFIYFYSMKKAGKKHSVVVTKPRTNNKTKRIQRTVPVSDYLKYYRVARYWMKKRYGLNRNDLETLLYLYSEGFFSKTKFMEWANIYSWEKLRFNRLVSEKWISNWRKAAPGQHAIYEVSLKGKRAMVSFYKKLEGTEPYPTTKNRNPLLNPATKTFTDKVYYMQMLKINKEHQKNK